jgi:hypothetical protein
MLCGTYSLADGAVLLRLDSATNKKIPQDLRRSLTSPLQPEKFRYDLRM